MNSGMGKIKQLDDENGYTVIKLPISNIKSGQLSQRTNKIVEIDY